MSDDGLFQRITGAGWTVLPEEVRRLHHRTERATGYGEVRRGRSILAGCIAFLVRFPESLPNTAVTVEFVKTAKGEIWRRNFAGQKFSSRLFAGNGRYSGLLCERFGPMTFAMALQCSGQRLTLEMRHWSLFGIPLPMFLCPVSDSYEYAQNGRMYFNVEISHPFVGLIVHYKGWLVPEDHSLDRNWANTIEPSGQGPCPDSELR